MANIAAAILWCHSVACLTTDNACQPNAKEGRMRRFLLPAFIMMGAITALFAGAVGDLGLLPDLSGGSSATVSHVSQTDLEQAAPTVSSPPPLPAVSPSTSTLLKEEQTRDALRQQIADLQQQAGSLRSGIADLQRQDSALQAQFAQHGKQLAQRAAEAPAIAEQQATRDALRQQIADLQQQAGSLRSGIADLQRQDSALQAQLAQHGKELAQRAAEAPAIAEQQATRDTLQRQIPALQRQIADLQRQDSTLQGQVAQRRQELTQSSQDLAQRSQELAASTDALTQRKRDLDAVRAETDKLRQAIDTLREQRRVEEAARAREKPQEQVAAALPVRPPVTKPAPRPAQPLPVRQPTQSTQPPQPTWPMPAPQPAQLMPAPSAAQQLQAARQWLSAGRPDEARRVLAMVQTQMVFQPVTPDQAPPRGGNAPATDVGDAIRWLDMGATGQAMQSINRAIGSADAPATASVAGSATRRLALSVHGPGIRRMCPPAMPRRRQATTGISTAEPGPKRRLTGGMGWMGEAGSPGPLDPAGLGGFRTSASIADEIRYCSMPCVV